MSNLKEKLLEIEKLANQLPDRVAFKPQGKLSGNTVAKSPVDVAKPPAGGSRFSHSDGGKPAAKPGAGVNSTSPVIKQMQFAMQNLGKLISNTIDYHSLEQAIQGTPGASKENFDASYGRDAFSNFMANRFLRNSPVKGVEFDLDPNKKKIEEKNPSELKNMYVVLDGLRRIGPSSKEFAVDGAWGQRTNNGLKNIAAIADSLMKLGKELGMESSSFDSSKLSSLAPLIPDDPKSISLEEKVERAPKITELLNGIQSLFKDFKDQVINNPHYKDFIINKKPLFTINPADVQSNPVFSVGEKAIYDKIVAKTPGYSTLLAKVNIAPQFTGGKSIQPIEFTGADLLSKESFTSALMKSKELQSIQQTNPATFANILMSTLDQVQEQINSKLNTSQVVVSQNQQKA